MGALRHALCLCGVNAIVEHHGLNIYILPHLWPSRNHGARLFAHGWDALEALASKDLELAGWPTQVMIVSAGDPSGRHLR